MKILPIGSERAAGARGLRLRRSHVDRLGADDRRDAPVDTEQGAGRTAGQLDVGDAQWVVCEVFKSDTRQ